MKRLLRALHDGMSDWLPNIQPTTLQLSSATRTSQCERLQPQRLCLKFLAERHHCWANGPRSQHLLDATISLDLNLNNHTLPTSVLALKYMKWCIVMTVTWNRSWPPRCWLIVAELGARRPANKIRANYFEHLNSATCTFCTVLTLPTKSTEMVSTFMHTPTIHSDMHCNRGHTASTATRLDDASPTLTAGCPQTAWNSGHYTADRSRIARWSTFTGWSWTSFPAWCRDFVRQSWETRCRRLC